MFGSKPFPFQLGKKKRKKVNNEKLGVGRLAISDMFRNFGVYDSVDSTRTKPEHAADGVVVDMANGGEELDNIQAAVDAVMESEPLTRRANTNSKPGKPATKQILIRATEDEHEEWRIAADKLGVSMSELVREAVRTHIKEYYESLECKHPMETMKVYPWAEICGKCGKRLKG
jgi:predicted HicB family RNase H-like nuclease